MAKSSNVFTMGIEEIGKSWGWYLTLGLLLMVLGVVCLGTTRTATTVSILTFGWILLFSGAVWFVGSFQARNWSGFFVYSLNAIVRVVAGYLLIRHPDAGAEGITFLLASLFVVGGIFRTVVAGVIQFPRWGWTALSGAVSVFLGIILIANWPASSTFFIGMAIGIDLILDGLALVGFAGAVHTLYKAQIHRTA
jgi:uncharacterized membrane protein HdeD (DUF308 family)